MNFSIFLKFLNYLKVLHWNTTSYAHHKILDDAYDEFSEKIDEFVESYIGEHDIIEKENRIVDIQFKIPQGDTTYYLFANGFEVFIKEVGNYADSTALESLVDDLNNIGNKTLYLLRMD